jgi:hypothetical protein
MNSIKLRFSTEIDIRGLQYIWIDPPWRLLSGDAIVMTSADYAEENFQSWSELLAPLNRTTLIRWKYEDDGTTIFEFDKGYRLMLPLDESDDEDNGYDHWYARDKSIEQAASSDRD